ncbi:hypothetical protein [Streptomyces sp. NPDC058695]|uniref:hypothetical protein n=1 Tax=Streptomyces sp. NPDC058695 TaxID=3346604 RepID=UPI00366677C6
MFSRPPGGVVGHYVTESAASIGAEAAAVSVTAERGAKLLRLGAAELGASVEDAEGRYDVTLESVGGTRLPVALARPALCGRLVWFGQASREPVTSTSSPAPFRPTSRIWTTPQRK